MISTNIPIVDQTIRNNFGVELEREIGRGKYGIVYCGIRNKDRKNCAVKVISLPTRELEEKLRDIYGDNEDAIESAVHEMAAKFETEIRSMRHLSNLNIEGSKNIIRMDNHMLVQEGICSHVIISMELAYPLKRLLAQEDFSVERVIDIGREVAQGLCACHSEGIIHRDIKEDNLFIGMDEHIKIGDFGVANISSNAISKKTEGIGTPHYMAPEIKNGGEYDETVDIYSLGIMMYMLLNENRPPFVSNHTEEREAYNRRMTGENLPPPKHAPKRLARIILKCCSYEPIDRYSSAADLIDDLDSVKNDMAAGELSATVPYPKRQLKDAEWWEQKFEETKSIFTTSTAVKRDILRDTVGAFRDLLQKFGNSSPEGKAIENVYIGRDIAERDMNEATRKTAFIKRILIILLCVVIVLAASLFFLYPKTASFYPNEADGRRVYVKYLFLPERRLTDKPASYLSSNGYDIFFSDTNDGKKLYKASIWTGKETLLCENECHYDVVIGDYIYFQDGHDKYLYRIKKDGTDLKLLIEYGCWDLRNKNGNLEFVLIDNDIRSVKELDVNSIE